MKKCIVPVLLVLLVTLWGITAALGQEGKPTAREQELMKRIDTLEKRLGELEKKCGEKPAGTEQGPAKKAGDNDLKAYWKDGLKLDSGDGAVKLAIGTLIQDDWASITPTSAARGGTEFRRARLSVSGTVRDNVEFKAEYDFATSLSGTDSGGDKFAISDGLAGFKDVWVGVKKVPYVGTIRAGHFKEPFGLEELTSDSWITFMERSLPTNAFVPDRNTGLQLMNVCQNQRMTWAAGVFHKTDNFGVGAGQNVAFTGRVTGLPWVKGDDKLVHLGFGLSYRNAQDDMISFSSQPEAHLAPKVVDTKTIAADNATLLSGEFAAVYKRASIQSEWMMASVNPTGPGEDLNFSGWYAQGSYFLTGEHRPYNKAMGFFDRPIPKHNLLNGKGGMGAWELAARYSHLNLTDQTVIGGKVNDWTMGVNWYLNPVTKWSLNYVISTGAPAADEHILEMRTQLSF